MKRKGLAPEVNLQDMRYPKRRILVSPSPPSEPVSNRSHASKRSASRKSTRTLRSIDDDQSLSQQISDKPGPNKEFKKILSNVLSLETSSKAQSLILKRQLLEACHPHIILDGAILVAKSELGRNLLKNGRFLKKCCQVLRLNTYFRFANLLSFIRHQLLADVTESKGEITKYMQKMLALFDLKDDEEPIVVKYDRRGNQIKQRKSQPKSDSTPVSVATNVDEDTDGEVVTTKYDQQGNEIKEKSPKQNLEIKGSPYQNCSQPLVPLVESDRVRNYTPFKRDTEQPQPKKSSKLKEVTPKTPSQAPGILRPSKRWKQSDLPSQQTDEIVYPNLDDLDEVDEKPQRKCLRFSTKDFVIQVSSNSENRKAELLHVQIMRTMVKHFNGCSIYSLKEVHLNGIIEYDFRDEGKFAVVAVVHTTDPLKREKIGIMPISPEIDFDYLDEIKKSYPMVECWVQNQDNVDVREYWGQQVVLEAVKTDIAQINEIL